MTEILLALFAFITSIIAAIVGFGGGMLLIAILPSFLPIAAIIPVHGATQLASNASRAAFAWRDVRWHFMPEYLFGSLVGILLFGFLLINIPLHYLPAFIGIYMLLNLWVEPFKQFFKRFESIFMMGFLQSGLGLVVGATGPLTLSLLIKHLDNKDQIIATQAVFKALSHLFKIFAFGLVGFVFWDYLPSMIALIVGAVAGSYAGTKIRHIIDGKRFMTILKIALTLMALKMIISVWVS